MSEKIVQLNEEAINGQIKELVRGSVEESLNELLEQEAHALTQARTGHTGKSTEHANLSISGRYFCLYD